MAYSVAVAGASGYGGGELLRLLADHPDLEVRRVTAHGNAGRRLRDVHPHLASAGSLVLDETSPETLRGHDVVFLALPHGASGALAAELDDVPLVVDAGADHRLRDEADWNRFYGGDWHGAWTYGMPELVHGDGTKQRALLRGATRIAVPGCNVTAVTLALAPALQAGLVDREGLDAVLAVGPSGAGKRARTSLLASELLGSASPYGSYGTHRHNPEIRQNLAEAAGAPVRIAFTPVLVPMARGIAATAAGRLLPGAEAADARAAYERVYGGERFIDLLDDGAYPRTGDVTGSNRVALALGIDADAGRLVVHAAIDNLGKGTAGAAVQSANLALDLDEGEGLPIDGVAP